MVSKKKKTTEEKEKKLVQKWSTLKHRRTIVAGKGVGGSQGGEECLFEWS